MPKLPQMESGLIYSLITLRALSCLLHALGTVRDTGIKIIRCTELQKLIDMIFLSYDLHIENESITMDRLFSFIIPVRMSIKLFCVKKEI